MIYSRNLEIIKWYQKIISATPVELENSTLQSVETKPKHQDNDEQVSIDSLTLDSLFSETEEEQQLVVKEKQPEDVSEQEETKTPLPATVQKESVFVRLANRIKVIT